MATNTLGNPNEASPIPSTSRRKSLYVQDTPSSNLLENNDETERAIIRNELTASTTSTEKTSLNNTRKSLGLSFLTKVSSPEIQERITECVKLNAENKINVKNAFSLKMIDFMTYMVKKDDTNMCNLQVASVSLDVSTTIYSYRVDGVHTEIIKIAGGLNKKGNECMDNNVNPENGARESQNNEKKKKKRNRQKILSTVNSLKGTVNSFKPALHIMENEDTQTTDALYQVMLPNHVNSRYCLHFCNDVILDTVENKMEDETTEVTIPMIKNFSDLKICPPLADFEFLKYSDDEREENNGTQLNMDTGDKFKFDLDASLPPDDEVCDDASYVNIPMDTSNRQADDGEDTDVHVEAQRPVKKIVDLCEVVSSNVMAAPSEYSFIPKSSNLHWAGPSHWKVRNLTRIEGSKIEGACQQEPVRKRKEVELCFDGTALEAVAPKFTKGRCITLNATKLKWTEEALILPRDMCYDIANASKLYLHELITVRPREGNDLNVTHISDQLVDYDYNNEHDASYCPNLPNEDYEEDEEANNGNECNVGSEDANPEELLPFTGENLVAVPKLTSKVAIAYSTRAKKLDMRQLKKAICKMLDNNNNNKENVSTENTENVSIENTGAQEKDKRQNERFSEVYKKLPETLTTSNAEALSFPIGFVSLLHIANEKNLELESVEEMSDIVIRKC